MKTNPTFVLVSVAAAGVALVIGPYFYVFAGPLSDDPSHWAQFGTYVGGVVTPLALLATLAAVVQNDRHRSEELSRLSKESLKSDLVRQIEKIERDLDSELERINLTISIDGKDHSFLGRDILFRLSLIEWQRLIPTESEIEEAVEGTSRGLDRRDSRVLAFEVFSLCAAHINRLRQYAKELDRASGHNAESLYLKRKYRIPVKRLSERGYKVDDWHDVAQQGTAADAAEPHG